MNDDWGENLQPGRNCGLGSASCADRSARFAPIKEWKERQWKRLHEAGIQE